MTVEAYYEKYKPLFDSPDRDIPDPPLKGLEESWADLIIRRREMDVDQLFLDMVKETMILDTLEEASNISSDKPISISEMERFIDVIKQTNIKWNDIHHLFLKNDGSSPLELNYFAKAMKHLLIMGGLR